MNRSATLESATGLLAAALLCAAVGTAQAQSRTQQPDAEDRMASSYTPVVEEPFEEVRARDMQNRERIREAARRLLEERYDLTPRSDPDVTMTRGKPVPVGPTARLRGVTWEQLGEMTPEEI